MSADCISPPAPSRIITKPNVVGMALESHNPVLPPNDGLGRQAEKRTQVDSTCRTEPETCLRIPDLFSGVMSPEVRVNPRYLKVKPQSEVWFKNILNKSDEWAAKNAQIDLAYLGAAWAPTADEDALTVVIDWIHWVLVFDDLFDEGRLKKDLEGARREMALMLAVLKGSERIPRAGDPLRRSFQDVCDRFYKVAKERLSTPTSFKELRERLVAMHVLYFDGVLQQVEDEIAQQTPTRSIQAYLDRRTLTIGVYPSIVITALAEGVELPEHIFQHPSLQECMRLSCELVGLHNDLVSFKKDFAWAHDSNIIYVIQKNHDGCSTQNAMDVVGEMLDECSRRWYRALAALPIYGEEMDRQVGRFVQVCRDIALGNLYWSFRTGRYLGAAQGLQVRRTRQLILPNDQSDNHVAKVDRDCLDIATIYT